MGQNEACSTNPPAISPFIGNCDQPKLLKLQNRLILFFEKIPDYIHDLSDLKFLSLNIFGSNLQVGLHL